MRRRPGTVCPLYFINGRVWHRDRFARSISASPHNAGRLQVDLTRRFTLLFRFIPDSVESLAFRFCRIRQVQRANPFAVRVSLNIVARVFAFHNC